MMNDQDSKADSLDWADGCSRTNAGLRLIFFGTCFLLLVFVVAIMTILASLIFTSLELDVQQPAVWWVSIFCSASVFAGQILILMGLAKCVRHVPSQSGSRRWASAALILLFVSFALSLIVFVATLAKPTPEFPIPSYANPVTDSKFQFQTVFLTSLNFVIISCEGITALCLLLFLKRLAQFVGQTGLKKFTAALIAVQLVFTLIAVAIVGVSVLSFAVEFNFDEAPTSVFSIGNIATIVFFGMAVAAIMYMWLMLRMMQALREFCQPSKETATNVKPNKTT